jgi:hypothetical protein
MKTRKEISSLIEEYLSGDISQNDSHKLFELISSNKFVRDEFIVRQRIDKAIRKKEIMELREQLKSIDDKRSHTNEIQEPKQVYQASWYKMAAAIILLAAIGYLIYFQFSDRSPLNQNQNQDQSILITKEEYHKFDKSESNEGNVNIIKQDQKIEQKSDSSQELTKKPELAINFMESAYFESFITNYRSNEIQIDRPLPGSTYSYPAEIQFSWRGNIENSLQLIIMNNREELVYKTVVVKEFTLKNHLDQGLYYWKLESEDELLYLNKFYIK